MVLATKLGTYPYTYLRTIVMKKKLLTRADYDKILKMTPEEIANYLQEFEYKDDIAFFGIEYSGAELIERSLQHNLNKDFRKLRRISPKELESLILIYQKRYDIQNIKTILRAVFSSIPQDEVVHHLSPIRIEKKEMYDRLLSLRSVEDIAAAIPFLAEEEVRKAVEYYRQNHSLLYIENLLDTYYYDKVLSIVNGLLQEGKLYRKFLLYEIDVNNLKVLLRLKKDNIDEKEIKDMVSQYGTLKKQTVDMLLRSDVDSFFKELENTPFRGLSYTRPLNLADIELQLLIFLLKESQKLIRQHPLSVDAIIGYMFLKDREIKNLSRIIKAKQLGLADEFIEKIVVLS